MTVVDPSGHTLKIPAWMLSASAAHHSVIEEAQIGARSLLELAYLVGTFLHESEVPSSISCVVYFHPAHVRERKWSMKPLVFKLLGSQSRELPVPLEERTQEELVELMAAAIAVIHTVRVEGSNDTCSRPEQDHGETPGA